MKLKITHILKQKGTPYILIILLIVINLCLSCISDTKFDLPQSNPVLAVLSSNDLDNFFQVRVTMAKPFGEKNYPVSADCGVKLFENGNMVAELKEDTSRLTNSEYIRDKAQNFPERIYIKDSSVKLNEGHEYSIEVNVSESPQVSATTTIPLPVKIKNISRAEIICAMPYWWYTTFDVEMLAFDPVVEFSSKTPYIEWTITFDDPQLTNNFYRIGVGYRAVLFKADTLNSIIDGKLQYASATTQDPVYMYVINKPSEPITNPQEKYYTYLFREMIFSDYNFNGQEYSLKIITPRPRDIQRSGDPKDSFKYIFSLYSLSEDYYKYWLDRYKVKKMAADPFSEPVRVHSNISNGAGIFAFSSFDCDTIPVDINY
jgi:hypothetical protein